MTEWFENVHFWENLESHLFTRLRPPSETKKEISGIIQLLKLKKGNRVLDLACGPGRITVPLAHKGFQMTGVDITPYYLSKLGRRANKQKVPVEVVKKDMSRFMRPNAFEAVINIFSSFGYFADPHRDQKTIENVFVSLVPGGQFLLDVMGREVLKRHFRERTKYKGKGGDHIVELAKIKPHWDWVENTWTVIRGQKQKSYTFGIRIFSGEELKKNFEEVGFCDVTLYGSFKGSPYNKEAERLIVVGKKP